MTSNSSRTPTPEQLGQMVGFEMISHFPPSITELLWDHEMFGEYPGEFFGPADLCSVLAHGPGNSNASELLLKMLCDFAQITCFLFAKALDQSEQPPRSVVDEFVRREAIRLSKDFLTEICPIKPRYRKKVLTRELSTA